MKGSRRFRFGWTFTSLLIVVALVLPWAVLADNVQNDVTVGGNDTFTLPGSTTVSYRIVANSGDGQSGCNASDGSAATVTINAPTGVTATPGSLTFTACSAYKPVVFTAGAAGNYEITVSVGDSGTGTYNTTPAKFTLHVLAPSDTTPPVITPSVSGTLGNNGWYVSDVSVSWSVTDPESAISSQSDCGPTTISADTAGTTLTCSATSAGGGASQSVTIKRDATAPAISGAASPASNTAGWNKTDVTVSFNCSDGMSGIASCGPNQTLGSEGAGQSVTGMTVDNAGNSNSATVSGINIDKTPPAASASASPGPNANGWNNTSVVVSFSGSDALSGLDSCSAPVTLSSEGAGQSASGTCADKAGNVSAEAVASGINIDQTAPVFGACPVAGPFLKDSGLRSVGPISVDAAISGLDAGASTLSGWVDTSSVGTKSVAFTAMDNADNGATKTCSYSVIYIWNGFFRPVDNLPVVNTAKAGSAIPIKFSLNGNQGLGIFAVGYPKSAAIACDSTAAVDAIEETVTAGNSSLSYDPLADQYVYVWKTDKAWTGCRQLIVKLNDGMEYRANFKFTK